MLLQSTHLLAAAPWRFETPSILLLLLAIPFIAALLWFAFLRRRSALKSFEGMTPRTSRPTAPRAFVKIALVAIGLSSLTISIARPQADPLEENVTVRGRDIVFLVDVSKSMLSRDAVPSRLGRAKLWINDLVNTLKGDRVGLVAFAGVPVVKCPLTLDLGYFRMALDELSPASVPRGGTLIGDAIRKTLSDVFEPGEGRYRDIVLITDGEDQGSFPAEAAKKAAEMGVRIIVIGIGSELEGALIPAEEENAQRYIERDGQKVRSKMDGSTLAAIAQAATQVGNAHGGGVFLNVGTGTMDLDKVYHDLIGSADQRETETKANVVYRELFPYFLAFAALCLGIEPMIAGRSRIRRAAPSARVPAAAAIATLAFAFLLIPSKAHAAQAPQAPATATKPDSSTTGQTATSTAQPLAVPTPSPDALYNSGRDLFLAGKYAEAAEQFRQSDLGAADPDLASRARFNLGQSLLKQATSPPATGAQPDPSQSIAQLDAAARAFRSALAANPGDTDAARNVEIARTLMQQKQDEQKKQQEQQDSKDKDKKSKNDQSKQDQKDQQNKENQKQSGENSDGNSNDQSEKGSESKQHQDNADKLKDLAKKQSEAAQKSSEASEAKNQPQQQEKQQQAKDQQQDVDQQTKEEQQKQEEVGKSSSDEAKKKLDEARKEQQAAAESLDKGDTEKAEEHQRKAADQLEEAAAAEQKAADQAKQQEQAKQDQAKQDQAKQAQAKEEKAKYDDTASQLLDRERKQREARQQILRALRGKPQPVDKDW